MPEPTVCPFCNHNRTTERHHVYSRKRYPELKGVQINMVRMCWLCHHERLHNHKAVVIGAVKRPPLTNGDIRNYMRNRYAHWDERIAAAMQRKSKVGRRKPTVLEVP